MRSLFPVRRSKWHRWASRLGLALALAAGLAYLPYRLLDGTGVRDVPQLRDELSSTRADIKELRVENARLRQEIDALKNTPQAIEDIARDDLGMVHPGDLVIRIEEGPR